ncbi:hypothetical protein COLO4_22010 [Corchorus olitorius]|uniref:Uncharacterized protein n=1 Tax=Corchorus olitorius TaxID=93759 RepID=A0A1R3IPQ6_9ROSI|nr:hypothetical protein COLO4_22010 [Corchorus olitorius]
MKLSDTQPKCPTNSKITPAQAEAGPLGSKSEVAKKSSRGGRWNPKPKQ